MKKRISLFALLLAISLVAGDAFAGEDKPGKLNEFEDEIESESSSGDDDDDNDCGFWCQIIGDIVRQYFWEIGKAGGKLLFYGLPADDNPYFKMNGFSEFPFAGDSCYFFPESEKLSAIRLSQSAFAGQDDIYGLSARIWYAPFAAMSLELQTMGLFENLNVSPEQLWIISGFMNYNRFRSPGFQYRYGGGLKIVAGNHVNIGPALNFQMDFSLKKPLSAYIYFDLASADQALVTSLQTGLNYHKNRYGLSAGLRRFRAGSVIIQGITISTGAWF